MRMKLNGVRCQKLVTNLQARANNFITAATSWFRRLATLSSLSSVLVAAAKILNKTIKKMIYLLCSGHGHLVCKARADACCSNAPRSEVESSIGGSSGREVGSGLGRVEGYLLPLHRMHLASPSSWFTKTM